MSILGVASSSKLDSPCCGAASVAVRSKASVSIIVSYCSVWRLKISDAKEKKKQVTTLTFRLPSSVCKVFFFSMESLDVQAWALLIALVSDGLFLGSFNAFVCRESFYLTGDPVLSLVLSFFRIHLRVPWVQRLK